MDGIPQKTSSPSIRTACFLFSFQLLLLFLFLIYNKNVIFILINLNFILYIFYLFHFYRFFISYMPCFYNLQKIRRKFSKYDNKTFLCIYKFSISISNLEFLLIIFRKLIIILVTLSLISSTGILNA